MKLKDRIYEIVEPKINELGYELYDVDFHKEYDNWELMLIIDSPKGITLDDCEAVSRAVDPILDEVNPIEQAYYLTVSSVGLDRPLKLDKDFKRNIGNLIDIRLYAAPTSGSIRGKKSFVGKLISYDEASFSVEVNGESITLLKKAAAMLRPHIEF